MKYLVLLTAILFLNLIQNYSQVKDSNSIIYHGTQINETYLYKGKSLIGPVIGYSIKSKIITYGINYEYAFRQNKTGIFTIGVAAKYNTAKEDILDNTAQIKTTNITFGFQGNFNFNRLAGKAFIPFAGLFIGYNNAAAKYSFNSAASNPGFQNSHKGALYFLGQAGIRYFFTKGAAIALKLTSGNINKGNLEFGVDIKF